MQHLPSHWSKLELKILKKNPAAVGSIYAKSALFSVIVLFSSGGLKQEEK